MIVGIIDLGSNSVRMSIADTENGETLYICKKAIKLSENMNEDMILKPEAVNRCVSALLVLKEITEKFKAEKVYAVATAAVRKAKNQDDFLELIKKETDIDIRVLSGEEEAYLDFLGVCDSVDVKDAVIIDTGGGSTEFIGVKNGKIIGIESFPIGSRSIKEYYFKNGESTESVNKAKKDIKCIVDRIEWTNDLPDVSVIGLGGSNRTVARISMNEEDKTGMIKGYKMNSKEVLDIIELVKKTPIKDRINIKGVTEDRCDILYGGLLPLECLIKKLNSKDFFVTDFGLREGILKKIRMSV